MEIFFFQNNAKFMFIFSKKETFIYICAQIPVGYMNKIKGKIIIKIQQQNRLIEIKNNF